MSGGEDTPRGSSRLAETPLGVKTPRETATGLVPSYSEPQQERLSLLVISDRLVATYPLPDSGEVVIGRAPKCDVMIDDASISRSHASLLVGPPMFIRDLGSANGTRVREQPIEKDVPVEVAPGDVMQIGSATLIVQRRSIPVRARRLWTHDYFEVRLEEECARAARTGATFALLRLRLVTPMPTQAAHEALVEAARGSDVVGEYGPAEYEVLLVDTDATTATAAANRLLAELAAREIQARVGIACYPRDGRSPDQLAARATPDPRVREASVDAAIGQVVVTDRRMRDLYKLAERVAAGSISVLVLGETGSGKEILAERVHKMSPRAAKPYLKLNCAALSETLLESELFGHERGAFTGAVQAKPGLLETADGGSVFLDEVGELPLSMQVKLLRVLEERTVLRVGGLKPRAVDIRIIAATNRDLEAEVQRGSFRQDLFFRLNGATLVLPPLRERSSEIPDLARIFLASAAKQAGLAAPPQLSQAALETLLGYSWPGNIRELRNVIERAVLLAGEGPIEPRHLPTEKMRVTIGVRGTGNTRPPEFAAAAAAAAARPPAPATAKPETELATTAVIPRATPSSPAIAVPSAASLAPRTPSPMPAPPATLLPSGPPPSPPTPLPAGGLPRRKKGQSDEHEERRRIEEALAACAGNQTAAAEMLGVSRRTLINRLEEFGMARPRKARRRDGEAPESENPEE